MKITVCELPDGGKEFSAAWQRLANHVHAARSELVLLPDMPFASWFAGARRFDNDVWQSAIRAHTEWESRLGELGAKYVLSSRPVDFGNERYDEGFVWDEANGLRSVHAKTQFRNETGAWESGWYRSIYPDFTLLELEGVHVGFVMGAELDGDAAVRPYGAEHVDVLAMPRGANRLTFDVWRARAKTLARAAGACLISSTRSGAFGGQACIVSSQGEVLGVTSAEDPVITRDVEVSAPHSIPLNVAELRDSLDPWETGVPPH